MEMKTLDGFGETVFLKKGNEDRVVVFLHGLAGSGGSFLPVAECLRNLLGNRWAFALPTAQSKSITVMPGLKKNAWFDVKSSNFESDEDDEGILLSSLHIKNVIDALKLQRFCEDKIFLGGFSQGGVIALHTALTSELKVGGIFVLSSYLAQITERTAKLSHEPVFIAYGRKDEIIKQDLIQKTLSGLRNLGHPCILKVYEEMGHEIRNRELEALCKWLQSISEKNGRCKEAE